ncbi:MAG: glycosyltransferase [Bacteroidaceae bacterium]|nr:glycosyltransferase [Bacteroidaceae bacterium]
MKILLIVGSANDIFITNMTKWLKASMPGSTIDIFEFYPTKVQDKNIYLDNLTTLNTKVWHDKIKGIRTLLHPFHASKELKKFLDGKYYDIIHCHWIIPPVVLTRNIHKHCNKLFATFWGREWHNFKILRSHKIYKKELDRFVEEIDYIINSIGLKENISKIYPQLAKKHIEGYLGSAALDDLYELMDKEDKATSKAKLSIDPSKKVVLIGYSGKPLHQHINIITELSKRSELKDKIHILAPMTRGAEKEYCDKVNAALISSGYTYTLLRDRFLSNEEVARLRYATDITLQLSTTDAFSRSIIECLSAKSVLIYGNWLNYGVNMSNNRFTGYEVKDIKEGIDKLAIISNNLEQYSNEVEQNSKNGKAKNIWSECIKDWVNAYINTK